MLDCLGILAPRDIITAILSTKINLFSCWYYAIINGCEVLCGLYFIYIGVNCYCNN